MNAELTQTLYKQYPQLFLVWMEIHSIPICGSASSAVTVIIRLLRDYAKKLSHTKMLSTMSNRQVIP